MSHRLGQCLEMASDSELPAVLAVPAGVEQRALISSRSSSEGRSHQNAIRPRRAGKRSPAQKWLGGAESEPPHCPKSYRFPSTPVSDPSSSVRMHRVFFVPHRSTPRISHNASLNRGAGDTGAGFIDSARSAD
ncbi:hypothetical protein SKAU_G00404340 [Synaphobranchus kaupii]|uniref:Uncharacterized protein n=1 Tax=Synaphobranchus kaupii TaxID=118154 RepID=A0A9Q1E9N0_SYNKA|nr:hypothetical protein SKAU_G00404340 [Synaphobranchus kaupii]